VPDLAAAPLRTAQAIRPAADVMTVSPFLVASCGAALAGLVLLVLRRRRVRSTR
jgi:hypothetical protein